MLHVAPGQRYFIGDSIARLELAVVTSVTEERVTYRIHPFLEDVDLPAQLFRSLAEFACRLWLEKVARADDRELARSIEAVLCGEPGKRFDSADLQPVRIVIACTSFSIGDARATFEELMPGLEPSVEEPDPTPPDLARWTVTPHERGHAVVRAGESAPFAVFSDSFLASLAALLLPGLEQRPTYRLSTRKQPGIGYPLLSNDTQVVGHLRLFDQELVSAINAFEGVLRWGPWREVGRLLDILRQPRFQVTCSRPEAAALADRLPPGFEIRRIVD